MRPDPDWSFFYFWWWIGYLVILSVSWRAKADVFLIVPLDHLQVPEVKKYVGHRNMMKRTENSDDRTQHQSLRIPLKSYNSQFNELFTPTIVQEDEECLSYSTEYRYYYFLQTQIFFLSYTDTSSSSIQVN